MRFQNEENEMKACAKCQKKHRENHPHFQIKSRLTDKGFPTHSKRYANAHEQADKAEKKKFGKKDYDEMKKVDAKLAKHELAGKNLKSGKLEVSKKVPIAHRKQVAFHEMVENKKLKRKK